MNRIILPFLLIFSSSIICNAQQVVDERMLRYLHENPTEVVEWCEAMVSQNTDRLMSSNRRIVCCMLAVANHNNGNLLAAYDALCNVYDPEDYRDYYYSQDGDPSDSYRGMIRMAENELSQLAIVDAKADTDLYGELLVLLDFAEEQPEMPDRLVEIAKQLNAVEVWLAVAYLLYEDSEYKAAIEMCNKAMELKPLCFAAILLRGLSRYRLGYMQSAWQDLLLVLNPEQCGPGRAYHPDKESEEALLQAARILANEHYKSNKIKIKKSQK